MNTITLLVLLTIISVSVGYVVSSRSIPSMTMWGTQKLGQSVIGTITTTAPASGTGSMFRRAPIGSGTDERVDEDTEEMIGLKNKSLYKISKSIRQHALLMELNGDRWSESEKMSRVSMAVRDDILPSSVLGAVSTASPHASSLYSGGLLDDWNFTM